MGAKVNDQGHKVTLDENAQSAISLLFITRSFSNLFGLWYFTRERLYLNFRDVGEKSKVISTHPWQICRTLFYLLLFNAFQ